MGQIRPPRIGANFVGVLRVLGHHSSHKPFQADGANCIKNSAAPSRGYFKKSSQRDFLNYGIAAKSELVAQPEGRPFRHGSATESRPAGSGGVRKGRRVSTLGHRFPMRRNPCERWVKSVLAIWLPSIRPSAEKARFGLRGQCFQGSNDDGKFVRIFCDHPLPHFVCDFSILCDRPYVDSCATGGSPFEVSASFRRRRERIDFSGVFCICPPCHSPGDFGNLCCMKTTELHTVATAANSGRTATKRVARSHFGRTNLGQNAGFLPRFRDADAHPRFSQNP